MLQEVILSIQLVRIHTHAVSGLRVPAYAPFHEVFLGERANYIGLAFTKAHLP